MSKDDTKYTNNGLLCQCGAQTSKKAATKGHWGGVHNDMQGQETALLH